MSSSTKARYTTLAVAALLWSVAASADNTAPEKAAAVETPQAASVELASNAAAEAARNAADSIAREAAVDLDVRLNDLTYVKVATPVTIAAR